MEKIFHLTAKDLDLSPSFIANMEAIRNLYPEWEIRVHTDIDIDNFVREYFPDYYTDVFVKMPMKIMQIDTVRYMWMYVFGGVYCDFDIHFLKLIEFPNVPCFVLREWTHPVDDSISTSVHNCIFASPKGHQVWKDLLRDIALNVDNLAATWLMKRLVKQPRVFDVTGPNAISRSISNGSLLAKYPEIKILPGAILYQKGKSFGTESDASVVHQVAGSWR